MGLLPSASRPSRSSWRCRIRGHGDFEDFPPSPYRPEGNRAVRCLICAAPDRTKRLYLRSMTGRIGAKGQVVIPKALRDLARLQPGDEVDFELRDEEIVLVARRSPVQLGGRFSKTGMAARLLEDRAREPR